MNYLFQINQLARFGCSTSGQQCIGKIVKTIVPDPIDTLFSSGRKEPSVAAKPVQLAERLARSALD